MFRRSVSIILQRWPGRNYFSLAFCTSSDSAGSNEEIRERSTRKFKRQRGTGDKGTSALFTGERCWKDDNIFEALGTVDELTCVLGIARERLHSRGFFDVVEKITSIQCDIQDLAAHVATPRDCGRDAMLQRTEFPQWHVDVVDKLIDEYAQNLPELTQFILPGGGLLAASLHHARAVCRRAERRVASLVRQNKSDDTALRYLNRLSDLLFVLARYTCYATDNEELSYKKPRKPNEDDKNRPSKWTKG